MVATVSCSVFVERGPDGGIAATEWEALVAADPSLVAVGSVSITSPTGESVSIHSPHFAEWSGHPAGDPVVFDFSGGGRITVGRPDDAVIAKLVEFARLLDATVVGEEGETYS